MLMCFAVWWPNQQLQSDEMTDGTHAWYKKALKLFFSLPRPFLASVETGEKPEQPYFEEL